MVIVPCLPPATRQERKAGIFMAPKKTRNWEMPESGRLIWHGTNIRWKELPDGRKVFLGTSLRTDAAPPAPVEIPKPFPRMIRRALPKSADKLPKEVGFVYLISFKGLCKIGMTCNLKERMSSLNRHWRMNNEYVIVHTIHSPDMIYLEALLHKRFFDRNAHAEWFNLTPDDVAWIIGLGSEMNEMQVALLDV